MKHESPQQQIVTAVAAAAAAAGGYEWEDNWVNEQYMQQQSILEQQWQMYQQYQQQAGVPHPEGAHLPEDSNSRVDLGSSVADAGTAAGTRPDPWVAATADTAVLDELHEAQGATADIMVIGVGGQDNSICDQLEGGKLRSQQQLKQDPWADPVPLVDDLIVSSADRDPWACGAAMDGAGTTVTDTAAGKAAGFGCVVVADDIVAVSDDDDIAEMLSLLGV